MIRGVTAEDRIMKEGYEGFRCKYRLPIDHSFDGSVEKKHHHVIEISVQFSSLKGIQRKMRMRDVEDSIQNILDNYRNRFINELPEFGGDSTIENMGEVLFKMLFDEFERNGNEWELNRFEISETPLRVYAIVADYSDSGNKAVSDERGSQ